MGATGAAAVAAFIAAHAARDAAREANKTNRIVGHATRVELRAYLSAIPAGINELIGTQHAMGHVVIRNAGKLPARNVVAQVRMKIGTRKKGADDEESVIDLPIAKDTKRNDVDRAIQPQAEMRQGAHEDDILPVSALLQQVADFVYVWGVVYYDDGYERRFTRFCHRYAIVAQNKDKWDEPAQKTRSIIDADKARYHPLGNGAN